MQRSRSRGVLCLLPLASVLAPPAAHAAVLPAVGTLSIAIATIPPVAITGSGSVVVNGSGGGPHLDTVAVPAGLFQTTGVILPVTDPGVFPIYGVQLTVANGSGTVTGGGGAIPLLGTAKVCLFGSCPAAVFNLSVPLSVVGAGGAATVISAINLTVIGAPWTTGTAAIGTITQMGFREGPLGSTSSTAQASGRIGLVAPVFVSTNIGSFAVVPAFAFLTLHFVPEPATLLLVAGGLVGVAAAGRRRLRPR